MAGKEVLVRFVRRRDDGGQPGRSKALEEAFQALKTNESRCEWFSNAQCMEVKRKDRLSVYVFEDFNGESFQNILATGNRIYGPICLSACLKNSEALPKLASPVYCLAMRGLLVSCSSIEKKEREELHQLIQWMGGEVSKNFHEAVTHLVAGEVGSKKYIVAASLKKDIMCPAWVRVAWLDCQTENLRATESPYSDMRCPIFKGSVLTVSGLDTYERAEVKELVEKEGGRYSGEMKINECTHLVINNPKGQKYEFAKKWKIHIVTPKWLTESMRAGYCLEEYRFAVGALVADGEARHPTSTPTKTGVPLTSSRLSSLSDMSAITVMHVNETKMNETKLNETRLNDTTASIAPRQSLANESVPPPPPCQSLFSRHVSQAELQAIDTLDLTAMDSDAFLDGCQIFLSGFSGARLEKLRRVINRGGGIRSSQITAGVTHVVIGDRNDDHMRQLEHADFRPSVVRVGWLLDSFQQGRCVTEDLYACVELPTLDSLSPCHKQKSKSRPAISDDTSTTSVNTTNTTEGQRTNDEEDMHQLMSQYLAPSADMTDESALLIAAEAASQQMHVGDGPGGNNRDTPGGNDHGEDPDATIEIIAPKATTHDPSSMNDTTLDPDRSDDVTCDQGNTVGRAESDTQDLDATTQDQDSTIIPEEGSLFGERTFVVLGFCLDDQKQLQKFIKENGGKVLSGRSRQVPHYAVVPVFGCPVNRTVNDIVTNAWLQMCIESSTLLPPGDNELFTPMTVHTGKEPLKGCVLSISGYTGTERDVLIHIAELIGARCQEYFVKNSNADRALLPSTHLVVNAPSGSKYNAAKKWRLAAVSKQVCVFRLVASFHVHLARVFWPTEGLTSMPDEACGIHVKACHQAKHTDSESWLFESARTGERASEDSFLIDRPVTANQPSRQTQQGKTDTGNRTSTPIYTTTHPSSNVDTAKVPTPVTLKASRSNLSATGPGQEQAVTPAGKENEAKQPSRIPSGPPGGAVNNARHAVAGSSGLRNLRVKELIEDNQKASPRQKAAKVLLGIDTPSKFLNTSKPFFPKFDLTDVMSTLDSPTGTTTPGGTKVDKRASTPLGELLTRNFAMAVENCRREPVAAGDVAMETNTDAGDSTNVVLRQDSPQPLLGVVIAVSKKLSSRQGEYNNIAASLGAGYRWTYDSSCTHFMFRGRPNDTNKEFRLAREQGKIIVSPYWLLACQEQEDRVDETLYPHQYNPNMSLSLSTKTETPTPGRRSSRLRKPLQREPLVVMPTLAASPRKLPPRMSLDVIMTAAQRRKEGAGDNGLDTTQSDEEKTAKQDEQTKTQTLVHDLKTLMAATRSYSKPRRKGRRVESPNHQLDDSLELKKSSSKLGNGDAKSEEADCPAAKRQRRTPRSSKKNRNDKSNADTHTEPSQMYEVTWDDPGVRAQQAMLASDLAKNSESFSPGGDLQNQVTDSELIAAIDDDQPESHGSTELVKESHDTRDASHDTRGVSHDMRIVSHVEETTMDRDVALPVSEKRPPPRFQFSGLTQQERDEFGAVVETLGGELSDTPHYDPTCSHLIIESPSKNEKYLASISAGKWVLHKSYIEACHKHSDFIKEEDYEWGGDGTASILTSMPPLMGKLASAAHRWRVRQKQKRQDDPDCPGVFQGWVVLLLADRKRESGFKRLLEAGGATVIASGESAPSLDTVTHAFVDLAKTKVKVDVKAFVAANVHCLRPEFIASFLLDEPVPHLSDYYISQIHS